MNRLYNVEVWINNVKKATYFLNAPYPVCVVKKKNLISNGIFESQIKIVKTK